MKYKSLFSCLNVKKMDILKKEALLCASVRGISLGTCSQRKEIVR